MSALSEVAELSRPKIEEVIQRFAGGDSDDELEEQRKHPLSLSTQQKFEFKMAFRVVAEGEADALPYEKLYALFQAMGYTFQDVDIDTLIENCYQDGHGNFSYESLLDAFDAWYSSQLSVDEVKATFLNIAGADVLMREAFTSVFFDVAGPSGDNIPHHKLDELLIALPPALRPLRCNFEPRDREILKEAFVSDSDGNYSLESLTETFDIWYARQLQADERTPRIFIEVDRLNVYVRQILNLPIDADPDLVTVAAQQLAEEISNDPHSLISYKDFLEIFKYRL